jgi:peroxidase
MHSSCLPIVISRSDPFYSPRDIRCLDFIRSNIIANNPYKVDIGEQVNAVTSFLDLSPIYGSDLHQMAKVRSYNGGRLKTNPSNVMNFEHGKFMSGDYRSTETPFLMIFHSLFIRNHNNIADKLGDLNRHWDRERLFQEARRVNIAIYQKIIYKEWLHHFISKDYASFFDDVNMGYNPDVDPSTLNEFSHSAFRVFHSFLPTQFEVRSSENAVRKFNLSDLINTTDLIKSYEDLIRGLINQKMSTTGYSAEVLDKLFKNKNEIGLDLLSIDLARGRDHGIPAYHKYRRMCNVQPVNVKVYDDLESQISKSTIIQLRQTYKTVYDIDLLVGGALEQVHAKANVSDEDSGVLGPTFQCVFFEQFFRWKSGDFYFYSHNTSGFTSGECQ